MEKSVETTRPKGFYGQIRTNSIEPVAPLRYCLYARKSSEEDERQALSIDSQIKEMLEQANREGLYIAETKKESHSAKDSGNRPIFNELLQEIKNDKFDAILTWAPDRVSRNAGDLGSVVDLMDQGRLKEIRTHGQVFKNSPNEKFLLMILCSQAKLENDNKGINVKRGLKARCDMGVRPGHCPLGYYNEMLSVRGKSRILIDPERAPIIREIFEKVAYSLWSGKQVYNWLMDELKFTTRTGKNLTLSGLYRILETTFYYGEFEFPKGSGNWYQGSHKPIITKDLFERARDNLISAPRKYGVHEFEFTKLIKCGRCGSGITAEEKIKRNKDGDMHKYTYYHCTKFSDKYCKEPYIREADLVHQIVQSMDQINFNNKILMESVHEEVEKFNRLSQAVFGEKMNSHPDDSKIDLKSYTKHILKEGSKEEKKELLKSLKTNFILLDGKIIIKNK